MPSEHIAVAIADTYRTHLQSALNMAESLVRANDYVALSKAIEALKMVSTGLDSMCDDLAAEFPLMDDDMVREFEQGIAG